MLKCLQLLIFYFFFDFFFSKVYFRKLALHSYPSVLLQQYQDAIKANKAGRNVNLSDLPVPPGDCPPVYISFTFLFQLCFICSQLVQIFIQCVLCACSPRLSTSSRLRGGSGELCGCPGKSNEVSQSGPRHSGRRRRRRGGTEWGCQGRSCSHVAWMVCLHQRWEDCSIVCHSSSQARLSTNHCSLCCTCCCLVQLQQAPLACHVSWTAAFAPWLKQSKKHAGVFCSKQWF